MLNTLNTFVPRAKKVKGRKKSKLPILEYVLVRDGQIQMNNLDHIVTMPVEDRRTYTLPLKILDKILKTKPETFTVADVDMANREVLIEYDMYVVTVPSYDPEEYPLIPMEDFQSVGRWNQSTFKQMKQQAKFCSKDDLKPALSGVYTEQNGKLEACTTDGHRLHWNPDLPVEREDRDWAGIIAKKAITILGQYVDSPVDVDASENWLRVSLDNGVTFYTKLVDERFPEFKSLLDLGDDTLNLQIHKQEILDVVKAAKPFWNNHTKQGVLNIHNSAIDVTVEDPEDRTEFSTDISLTEPLDNDPGAAIGFNLQYLADVMRQMEADTVQWQYKSPISASLFTDGTGSVNLLLPIRLNE